MRADSAAASPFAAGAVAGAPSAFHRRRSANAGRTPRWRAGHFAASCAAALMSLAALTPGQAQTGPSAGTVSTPATAGDVAGAKTQMRLLVGSSPGGGYDTYARLISAHLPRYLPGNPRIVVQNMPGAGSLVVSNHLVNIAPRDGSVFAAVHSLAATHPLFHPERARYDARNMVWIGSAVRETTFGLARVSSNIQTLKDLFKQEVIVAGSTGSTTTFPTFLNSVIGTRFNVVKGYNATSAALLALERGEVDGVIGVTGPGMRGLGQRLVEQGRVRVFVQFGMSRHPDHPKTDWVFDHAERAEQRVAMNLMFGTQEFGRPFVAPPGVGEAATVTLRNAFANVLKDEQLLEEARKRRVDIAYTSPQEIETIIASMYEAPPDAIALVKSMVGDQAQ